MQDAARRTVARSLLADENREGEGQNLQLGCEAMGCQVVESAGAEIPSHRMHRDPHTQQVFGVSAQSHTPQSFRTAIRADIGESEAYKQALLRGEIGLQRPLGTNVSGVDFITAVRAGATGIQEIVCTDVKTSEVGRFPAPKKTIPGTWLSEVQAAVAPGRLKLRVIITDVSGPLPHNLPLPQSPAELAALETEIVQAVGQNRIRLRQLNADYYGTGQGVIRGW
jgi:hypothetical protein